jgi:ATP-dependent HslUV protease subunit HslV
MMHATTILAVRAKGKVAFAGDGQVTLGNTVIKHNAKKVRKIFQNQVLVGFAGSTADAFTLLEKFEARLNQFGGDVRRASVELAKEWRTDKMLRRLEAMMLAADREHIFILSGNGDVLEPEEDCAAIGSGGAFALCAARAYLDIGQLDAEEIAQRSLLIAAKTCIYTNDSIILEVLP